MKINYRTLLNILELTVVSTAVGLFFLAKDKRKANRYRPISVEVRNLNGDELTDLVIRNKAGDEYNFIQQNDGTYRGIGE